MQKFSNNVSMKSLSQISDFIKTIKCADEIDKLAITQYCQQTFGIKARFTEAFTAPSLGIDVVTFDQFKEWTQIPAPERGDVIVYEYEDGRTPIIAIVRDLSLNDLIIGATLSEGKLMAEPMKMPNEGHRPATGLENKELFEALTAHGLEWNEKYNKITERFIPINANIVKVKKSTGEEGCGYFDEIAEDGSVIMYCVKFNSKPVDHALDINIGHVSTIKFEAGLQSDKKKLADALKRVNKIWNGYMKRIEPVNMRVEKGEPYWYVNEKFNVVIAHESLGFQDKRRFICGNYFTSPDAAIDFARKVIELRKKELAAF